MVRLRRPGDRRRRIANISQLKPYYAVDTRSRYGYTNKCRLIFQMDEVIMVSDDSDDTEAFYPGANYGDGRE